MANVELTPQCWTHVFSQLPSRDVARAACVQRQWRELVRQDEHLWGRLISEDLGLSTRRGADGAERPTFREAYGSWRASYGAEYWPYLPRAIRAWDRIKGWLAANFPAVAATIRAGASEAEVAAVEAQLGFTLPAALKVLYRLHDGQELLFDSRFDRQNRPGAAAAAAAEPGPETAAELGSIFHGLFGGYSVYGHLVVCRLMPLARAARWTADSQLHKLRPQLVYFACSFQVQDKMFVVDCASGGLAVVRRNPSRQVLLQPAVPPDPSPGSCDGVLRWFEEYGRRLAGGCYELAVLDEDYPEGSRAISLFPLLPDAGLAEAVTRGVRVRASSVYAPEQSPAGKHLLAYCLRFQLLPPQAQLGALPPGARVEQTVARCQLLARHWVIRDERGEVADEVRGDGVIGKYPVLEAGGPEFSYCSCTHQAAARGSMEGAFRFVEGTLERQAGGAFEVACPRFSLEVPPYIY